jgi:hypothetical protein
MLGRWAESDTDLEHSIALADAAGDTVLHGEALCAGSLNRVGRPDEAAEYLTEAAAVLDAAGDPYAAVLRDRLRHTVRP